MCVECDDDNRITRRSFLAGATAVITGLSFGSEAAGQQQNVLTDPGIVQEQVARHSDTNHCRKSLNCQVSPNVYRLIT
jgi:hypothetical protein